MNILRFLRPACIDLALAFAPTPPPAGGESAEARGARLRRDKERLLGELAALLARSGEIINVPRFAKDLLHRERKATTAIAPGVAIPHVRSYQARSFVIGLARLPPPGIDFASLDGEPTRLFVLLTSPPWDDRTYLQVYREFVQLVQDEEAMRALLAAESAQEVFNALRAAAFR